MKLSKNQKLLGSSFGIIAIALLIVTGGSFPVIENVKQFNISTIPDEIDFSSAYCFAKAQTWLVTGGLTNPDGFLRADNSPFNIDHPQYQLDKSLYDQLSFVDPETGTTLSDFGHFLKMRCEIGFNISQEILDVCSDPEKSVECPAPNENDLFVQPSQMEVKMFAQYADGQKDEVFNGKYTVNSNVVIADGKEGDLMFAGIDMEHVLKNMRNGSYDALIEVRTSGVVEMKVQDVYVNVGELATFKYYLGELDIPTYFNLKVNDNQLGTTMADDDNPNTVCSDTNSCEQEQEQQMKEDEMKKESQNQNSGDPDESEDKTKEFGKLIDDYSQCWLAFDIDCIMSDKFIGFNLLIGLLFALIFIAIIASAIQGRRPRY